MRYETYVKLKNKLENESLTKKELRDLIKTGKELAYRRGYMQGALNGSKVPEKVLRKWRLKEPIYEHEPPPICE